MRRVIIAKTLQVQMLAELVFDTYIEGRIVTEVFESDRVIQFFSK